MNTDRNHVRRGDINVAPTNALLLFLIACLGAASQPAIEPALLKRLEAIDAKAAAVTGLSATFEQKKISPLLKNPLVSRGTVYAAGDAMLWKTDTPEPTRLRIDGHSLQLYDLRQKTLEIYPLGGKLASMAASPLPRLATLREKFDIAADESAPAAAGTLALVLTPRDAEMKQYVDRVCATLDEATGIVRRFVLTDPDGEETDITFTDAKPNATDAGATELRVPPGTKTVRPLGPASP